MSGTAPLLLLSMPQMADPNFARTVVLLCDYTAEDGAFGLVVNRQMSEPACEIVRTEPPVRVDPDLQAVDWRTRRSAEHVGVDGRIAGSG